MLGYPSLATIKGKKDPPTRIPGIFMALNIQLDRIKEIPEQELLGFLGEQCSFTRR